MANKKSNVGLAIIAILVGLVLMLAISLFILKTVIPSIEEAKKQASYVPNDEFGNKSIEGSTIAEKERIVKIRGNVSSIIDDPYD